MAPTHAELERAIASVPGVISASVDLAESTGRSRLRLRLAPGEDAESVSWSVAATLRERFGIALDPDAIRPRQTDAAGDADAVTDEVPDAAAEVPDAVIDGATDVGTDEVPDHADDVPGDPASDPIRIIDAPEPQVDAPEPQVDAPEPQVDVDPLDADTLNPLSRMEPIKPLWPRSELAASRDRLSAAAREALDGLHSSFASARAPSADARAPEATAPRGADALFAGVTDPVTPSVEEPASDGSDTLIDALLVDDQPVRPLPIDGTPTEDAPPVDEQALGEEVAPLVDGIEDAARADEPASGEDDPPAAEAPLVDGPATSADDVQAAEPTGGVDESVVETAAVDGSGLDSEASAIEEVLAVADEAPDEVPAPDDVSVSDDVPLPDAARPAVMEDAFEPRDPRAVIRHLDTQKDDRDVRITATLEHDGRSAHGEAQSIPTSLGVLRAVAEATVDALRGLTDRTMLVGVDRISMQPAGEPAVATVVLTLLSDRGEELLLGSSIVRGDPERAVMRATLDALNRRVAGMLTPVERTA